MKRIRVLLIEDNRILREGIKLTLKKHSDVHINATGRNDTDIMLRIAKFKPGVILFDPGTEDKNNVRLVKLIKKDFHETKIIVIDIAPLQSDVFDYVQAGVSGFIYKEAGSTEFFNSICKVNRGINVLPYKLTGLLFSQIIENACSPPDFTEINKSFELTKREKEVMVCIAEGFTNKEIASKLHLSIFTIKSHVHNILEKLSISTRIQIAKHVHQTEYDKNLPINVTSKNN